MSSFGARRKARVIKIDDDEETSVNQLPASSEGGSSTPDKPTLGLKPAKKPFRQSGLRKTFNPDADAESSETSSTKIHEDEDGPVVVRPAASRLGSNRRKPIKSKLSFGGDNPTSDDGWSDDRDGASLNATAKQKVPDKGFAKRTGGIKGLPLRSLQSDDDRPRYSREYLDELQTSTPTTPRDISSLHINDVEGDSDMMDLDAAELEGAVIVDSPSTLAAVTSTVQAPTQILTEAEIREKKERRARLAQEQDFLSMDDDGDDDGSKKKKEESRLRADDEELGEGFDDYVEDGGLSLGKRAEKERRKRERQKMAELITAAEGNTSDSSSDSDAERRIAYEAAQTRAGMDGLKRQKNTTTNGQDPLQIPQKFTPLPNLNECLARLQATLGDMQTQISLKTTSLQQLQAERENITKREAEVQALLDETGKKYQEVMNGIGAKASGTDATTMPSARVATLTGEGRGLESLGTTPSRSVEDEEVS